MKKERLQNPDQFALLIWDDFRGQKKEMVTLLEENRLLREYIPSNMTDYFEVLNLTVNKWVKDFMKKILTSGLSWHRDMNQLAEKRQKKSSSNFYYLQ